MPFNQSHRSRTGAPTDHARDCSTRVRAVPPGQRMIARFSLVENRFPSRDTAAKSACRVSAQ
jgi:hypothetical protein